ncbi:hypothetical protein [[Pseudopropionibacterium] massiliense]|uniref:hypothetical protein n=1 Tax=[Pseudopropionibacterium] massiliense TaxID=2220000 RepID=UPI001031B8B7|nr:hypothetical protein [[Pseudopropionibacterium] massiliense]
MYSALDPALQSGQHASDGCLSVKAAMTLFADEISALKPERDELAKEAASFDAKSIPEDEDGRQGYMDEAVALNGKIVVLIQKYETAINTCFEQLAAIGNDGLPTPDVPAWSGVPGDTLIAALAAVGETRKVDVERVIRRVVIRLFGEDFRIPYWVKRAKSRHWDWKSWIPQTNQQGSFLTRFRAAVTEAFLGPPRGRYGPATVIRPPHITGSWGLGREHSLQTRTGTSALGRTAGRGLFVLGVGLTYSSGVEKADTRYREQNPELSASERQSRVRETATVRTGSQVLASAWAGAAIGSMLPVGGTAVGLAVGVVVGLGMSIDTGEGKTVGDRIADVGEGFWNWCKGVFGR